ncbi:hypothetical protein BDZ91DRAFT_111442 [Kalaharituber pfeilii]|nr:hypothetical protein BDZ91DRAFT_111442 [Kalaharituber pfeilii]
MSLSTGGATSASAAAALNRKRSLSTPQRLLRRTLRNSFSSLDFAALRATSSTTGETGSASPSPIPRAAVEATSTNTPTPRPTGLGLVASPVRLFGEVARVTEETGEKGRLGLNLALGESMEAEIDMKSASHFKSRSHAHLPSNSKLTVANSKRSSQEPLRKKQKKEASRTDHDGDDNSLHNDDAHEEEQGASFDEHDEVDDNSKDPSYTPRTPKRTTQQQKVDSLVANSNIMATTRSMRAHGPSATPRRTAVIGKTPVVKREPEVTGVDGVGAEVRESAASAAERNTTATTTVATRTVTNSTSRTTEVPRNKNAQQTTIQVEDVADYEGREAEDDNDYRDFIPELVESGSPSARNAPAASASRRSTRSWKPELGLNKVKTGRISKFKEGSMNDRVSARPPQDLIDYAYSNSSPTTPAQGLSSSEASGVSQTPTAIATHKTRYKGWLRPRFLPRKYTGDEAFTLSGFFNSVRHFRGLEYCRENLWGPTKQKVLDRLHVDLQKFRQEDEVAQIKKKAEELYRMRKEKEWKEMERKKQMAVEDLRRRKERERRRKERFERLENERKAGGAGGFAGRKRKFGEMAESFGGEGEGVEGDRVWDEVEQAQQGEDEEEKTEVDEDVDEEIEEGEEEPTDWCQTDDEESDLDEQEIKVVEELVRSVTGRTIIAMQDPTTSRAQSTAGSRLGSVQTSLGRRKGREWEDDGMVFSQEAERHAWDEADEDEGEEEQDEDVRCGPSFLQKGKAVAVEIGTTSITGANTNSSASVNVKGGVKGLPAAIKNKASKVFGIGLGSANGSVTNMNSGDKRSSVISGSQHSSSISSVSRMPRGEEVAMENDIPPSSQRRVPREDVYVGADVDKLTMPPPPLPERKFTKRELAKQDRLRKKVAELEGKLYETWMELERAAGAGEGQRQAL